MVQKTHKFELKPAEVRHALIFWIQCYQKTPCPVDNRTEIIMEQDNDGNYRATVEWQEEDD